VARKKKRTRARKAEQAAQRTAARLRAEAERQRQREGDERREGRQHRVRFAVATTVGAAATFTVIAAPATGGIAHVYRPYSAASQPYALVRSSDSESPDNPHTPEQGLTEYPVFFAAGTATTVVRILPDPRWDAWERTNLFGD